MCSSPTCPVGNVNKSDFDHQISTAMGGRQTDRQTASEGRQFEEGD